MTLHDAEPGRRHMDNARVKAAIIGAVTLALSLALLVLAWTFIRPLALLLAAIILSSALDPIVCALSRSRWISRGGAIGLLYLAIVAVLAMTGWFVVPPLIEQGTQAINALPALIDRGQALLAQRGLTPPTPGLQSLNAWISGAGSWLVSLPLTLVSSLLEIVLVLGMSAYWLVVVPQLRELVVSLVPRDRENLTRTVISGIGRTMGGYIRGTVINAAIVGMLVYVGLLVIGLDYPLALGMFAAVGEVVPYLGPTVAAVPAVFIAFLDSPGRALLVAGFYFAMQMIENQILVPQVMRQQTHVPPVLVIFAIAAGGSLGGVLGALVAVPLAGALLVVSQQLLLPAIRRRTRGEQRKPANQG